jgi:hypothetical protein
VASKNWAAVPGQAQFADETTQFPPAGRNIPLVAPTSSAIDGKWKTPPDFRREGASFLAVDLERGAFSFFGGRAFKRMEAGFAANHLFSPENGSLPKRHVPADYLQQTPQSDVFAPFLWANASTVSPRRPIQPLRLSAQHLRARKPSS